ncbi:hypothetical protein D3C71_2001730 [compost metagenome]
MLRSVKVHLRPPSSVCSRLISTFWSPFHGPRTWRLITRPFSSPSSHDPILLIANATNGLANLSMVSPTRRTLSTSNSPAVKSG